jgi:hypothetical protein
MDRGDELAPAAEIVVRRRRGYPAALRKVRIYVDGRYVGGLLSSESMAVRVEPGRHEVRARIDWTRSPVATIDASTGDRHRLVVSYPWSALWRTFWKPGSAVRLGPDPRAPGAMYPR